MIAAAAPMADDLGAQSKTLTLTARLSLWLLSCALVCADNATAKAM
jgi:hypothetical protein